MSALVPEIGILIQNDSGSVIPPRSVVICTSVEIVATGTDQEMVAVHHVDKFNTQVGNFLVTGTEAIPATSTDGSAFPGSRSLGTAYFDNFIYTAIDQSVATPKVGEQWGPCPGQWYVTRGGLGFFAQGYPASNGDVSKAMFYRDRGWICRCSVVVHVGHLAS